MHVSLPEVYLARHGETAWTPNGQHTGRTDIPLTARGEHNALSLRPRLNGVTFAKVLAARWLGLPADKARRFVLTTAALSILGYEHTLAEPAIRLWNDDRHVVEENRESVEKRGNV